MADSLSDERLAEIDAMQADYKNRCGAPGAFRCCSAHPVADTVPELRAEVERLRAELAAVRADGKEWHDTYQDTMNGLDRFLGDLRDLLPGAADTGADAYDQIPRAIKNVKAERDRYRLAWESARRGRREARDQVKAARPYIDWLHERRRSLFDDRDRLAEENDRLRSDIEAAKRGWRKDVAIVERVRAWVNGDVVTARSEFGSGYREAMRDVRDLLAAREAKEESRG